MQYHLVFSRINPALKIDVLRICYLESGNAVPVDANDFFATVVFDFPALSDLFRRSDISDSLYVYHSDLKRILTYLSDRVLSIDYFDNNLVIIFDYEQKEKDPEEE